MANAPAKKLTTKRKGTIGFEKTLWDTAGRMMGEYNMCFAVVARDTYFSHATVVLETVKTLLTYSIVVLVICWIGIMESSPVLRQTQQGA